MNKKSFEIRSAKINDASDISELSNQLGYSTSETDISERLNTLLNSDDHIVYVAVLPNGKIIGWIHVFKAQRLESGSFAEIGGFIVSERFRSRGIGKKLLQAAVKWTIQKKLPRLRVRSRIDREEAKNFIRIWVSPYPSNKEYLTKK